MNGSNTLHGFQDGDVLDWSPEVRWCREGIAVVRRRDDGSLFAADTFWLHDDHVLSDDELATATLRFQLDDFDECDPHASMVRPAFEDFAANDTAVMTSQHGLRRTLYVRKGAVPDAATRRARADETIREAEEALQRARGALADAVADREALDERIEFEDAQRRAPFDVGDRVLLYGVAWRSYSLYSAELDVAGIDEHGRPYVTRTTESGYRLTAPIYHGGRFADYRAELVRKAAKR